MFCGLGKEERTRFRKKKKEKGKKKKKKLIAAKSELVEIKKYLKKYNPVILKPFLNETAFYGKLSGPFFGPKTKVT